MDNLNVIHNVKGESIVSVSLTITRTFLRLNNC